MIDSGTSLYGTPIPPLVLRHAQDAAWYWTQLEADRFSPLVDAERARYYQHLFTCHLEGLRLSDPLGWTLAHKELARWKDPEQLFVCWWLALQDTDPEKTASLWPFMNSVRLAEEVVATALLWSAAEHRAPWLHNWLHNDVSQVRRMALVACALNGELPDIALHPLFDDEPLTVAATCRLAGALRLESFTDHLLYAARSSHPEVREQAGMALLACHRPEDALPLLLEALLRHHANMESGEGGSALFEEHRAQVLACLCGHALPFGELSRVAGLPPYLLPLVYAHHGDAATLPLLADLLETPHAPTVLRVICRLTGLAAEDQKLCLPAIHPGTPEFDADPPNHPGHHLESGLPMPDVCKIRAWLADNKNTFPTGVPLLHGKEATLEHCLTMLETGMQDDRFAAAWHAMYCSPCLFVDTTAPFALQTARIQDLHNWSERA